MRHAVVLGLVGVVIGLLVGYLVWELPVKPLIKELTNVKADLVEQTKRADAAQGQLEETEAELKRVVKRLSSERDLREKYQELVSEGQK
jgi:uncharacterized membrane-anchored protein YhcB (DUF1043 family)